MNSKPFHYGYSYAVDAGRGSDTFHALAGSARWRAALLGTVAAGALWVAVPRSAKAGPDACNVAGNVATCTGNQSDGIASGTDFPVPQVDTLNVNSLTANIAPAAGVDGINFTSTGAITINSDTQLFFIQTTGNNGDGIFAHSTGGETVTIDHTGDIQAGGRGIDAYSQGNDNAADAVSVTSAGDITTSSGTGIIAHSGSSGYAAGAVTVTSTGDINATVSGYGIEAISFSANGPSSGPVTLTSAGNISAASGGGLRGFSTSYNGTSGDVTVTSEGNIATHYNGIYAVSRGYDGAGAVEVNSTGDIANNSGAAIYASSVSYNGATSAVSVTSTGDIATSGYGSGIYASSRSYADASGNVEVNSTGNIVTAEGDGITAFSEAEDDAAGTVTVVSEGNITSGSDGIDARSVNSGYGYSGNVTVTSTGNIDAENEGIFAESSAEGGYAGSVTVTSTGDIDAGNEGIYALSEASGGAGNVTVTSTGNIVSAGSSGIVALSLAYYGYSGAVEVNNNGNITSYDTGISAFSESFNYDSGTVTVNSEGNITSSSGHGIYAGTSSQYGVAGQVTVYSTGNIQASSDGIYARSFSQYGDASGVAVTNDGDIVSSSGRGIRALSGAPDGYAGPVTVNSAGDIEASSDGIYARSYGRESAGTVAVTSTGNIVAGIDGIMARSEAAYGAAGNVTVVSEGNITSGADGIDAFSRNTNSGNAGNVEVTSTGNIEAVSQGIIAESNAAAGNAGSVTVTSTGNIESASSGIFALSEALAGTAGPVTVNSTGDITASGDGIYARSRGLTSSGAVTVTNNSDITSSEGRGINAESLGQTAGLVTVTSTGDITAHLIGIYARSGRTDGVVEVTNSGNVTSLTQHGIVGFSFSVFGDSGPVTVISTGDIAAEINGIYATSYGETSSGAVTVTSGGNITSSTRYGIAAISSSNGDAGPVTVNNTATIDSFQNGILAQSGGFLSSGAVLVTNGGNLTSDDRGITASSLSNGAAGPVTVNSSGDITAASAGILARSEGSTSSDAVAVTVTGGTVRGGVGGAGVEIAGGTANTLTIGAPATVRSLSGLAISGGTGSETVNNSGRVIGNVALGGGSNAFNNLAGGRFEVGIVAELGGGNLANSGTLSPGGANAIQTSAVGGSLSQGAGGVFAVDVDIVGGQADRVDVTGAANLNGQVLPNLIGFQTGTQTFTILTAGGGITNAGISVQDTPVVNYELEFPDAQTMNLVAEVDFAPAGLGLTPNQQAVATNVANVSAAGGGALGSLLDYLAVIGDIDAFAAALDRLHPEPYLAQVHASLFASLDFTNSLMSCPTAASPTANAFVAQGQCVWLRTGGRFLEVDRTRANIGFEDKAWNLSAGVQGALAPNWFASAALGYDRSNLSVDNRASAEGDIFHAGAALKYIEGNVELSAAVTGGLAKYDTTRSAPMPGVNAQAGAEASFLAGRLRAAYVVGTDTAYMKPLVDFDLIGIRRDGIRETGAGPAGLNVKGQSDTFFSIAPAVEFGSQIAYAGGVMRPFLRVGARFFSEEDLSATAVFIGAPAGVPAFTVTTPLDRWVGEIAAGLEMLGNDRYDMRVSYEGRLSERSQQHGGSVKFRARF